MMVGSDQQAPLSGPDFAAGIPAAAVAEGALVLGHAGGEAVVLTRCGGKLRAVGASCTHYGGPLAEGVVVDGTIRCPWHHAAFDLETGDAVRPPALNPIPCWEVEERAGRVVVGARRAPAAPARHRGPSGPESGVIVGGGAAGAVAAQVLRDEGYEGPVTLLSAEGSEPVDRPNLSKDYLAGNAPEEWIPLRPAGWYAERGITLRTSAEVKAIDAKAKRVTLADGSELPFGALLLATGAEPIRLPARDGSPVYALRTLADSRAIIARAAQVKRAVVVGASFIGLEVAASLRARGLQVTVVAPDHQPLEHVLGEAIGRAVHALHEAHGVRFMLGRLAKQVDAQEVLLDDGTRLPAELVVAGIGVRPNVRLATAAGLRVNGGVMVDAYLSSSVPGIYAAGDIARWPDAASGRAIRVEHWAHAERMGRTAARNILGAAERFDTVPFFWSAHYDLTIGVAGHAELPDWVEVDGDPGARDCTVRYYEGDRLAAVATIGRDRELLLAEARMELALREQPLTVR
jgi:NADPH-dependent 2,4-dienoyl-CoA reductase/sulfur reductase-like enzyme/nitrite reductase/ring-hydroxylating ferredoxin subunit